jgi:hypothetical protein
MGAGKTYVVINNEGILKRGMTFSFMTHNKDHVYLWAHKPILGMNQFKFDVENIKRNFRIV